MQGFEKPLSVTRIPPVEEPVGAELFNVFLNRGVCEGENAAEVEFVEGDAVIAEAETEPEAGSGNVVDVREAGGDEGRI